MKTSTHLLLFGILLLWPILNCCKGQRPCQYEFSTKTELEEFNKRIVLNFARQGIFPGGNFTSAALKFILPDYIQHNPLVGNGRAAVIEAFQTTFEGIAIAYIRNVAADGNYVWLHSLYTLPNNGRSAIVDIFRLECGWIAEHWDVIQNINLTEASANPAPFF